MGILIGTLVIGLLLFAGIYYSIKTSDSTQKNIREEISETNNQNIGLLFWAQKMECDTTECRIKNPVIVRFALQSYGEFMGSQFGLSCKACINLIDWALRANIKNAPTNFQVPQKEASFYENGSVKAESFLPEDWIYFVKDSITKYLMKLEENRIIMSYEKGEQI